MKDHPDVFSLTDCKPDLVGEGEDAVLLGVRLALTLSQATQVASAGSRCLKEIFNYKISRTT